MAPEDRPTNSDGWIALGKRPEKAAQPLIKAGYKVAWHNHDFELFVMPQGDLPLNLLMANARCPLRRQLPKKTALIEAIFFNF